MAASAQAGPAGTIFGSANTATNSGEDRKIAELRAAREELLDICEEVTNIREEIVNIRGWIDLLLEDLRNDRAAIDVAAER